MAVCRRIEDHCTNTESKSRILDPSTTDSDLHMDTKSSISFQRVDLKTAKPKTRTMRSKQPRRFRTYLHDLTFHRMSGCSGKHIYLACLELCEPFKCCQREELHAALRTAKDSGRNSPALRRTRRVSWSIMGFVGCNEKGEKWAKTLGEKSF